MEVMKVVTSGARYIDIDAYAGCVAYAELLRLQGHEAKAVSLAPWNESISKSVQSWQAAFETSYASSPDDTFVIIDVSDPTQFDTFVDLERVSEVIDHHPGFEAHWEERIGKDAHIEFIGAACTQVYEQWKTAGLIDKMSVTSARLLIAGILDNTLNFGAHVTTDRDELAYEDLLKRADLPDDWTKQYFTECQDAIFADVSNAVANDTKVLTFTSLPGTIGVGQLVVWDAKPVLEEHKDTIRATLAQVDPIWFLNLVNVGERKSYFVCEDAKIQKWLSRLLGVTFDDSVAQADRLWLRKEIIKADIEATPKG
jgi:inorganic pyrophosphatase